jgi:hypothetical protein
MSFQGSRFQKINENITLGCISTEAKDLLDKIMHEWEKHKKKSHHKSSIYGFAYWLVRWSGLIQPSEIMQAAENSKFKRIEK